MPSENTPELPPLPELTSRQWHALPREEKRRLRHLKLMHKRLAEERAKPPPAPPPCQDARPPDTPFRDLHRRPLYMANIHYGASCFLLLSGPSSLDNDLTQLRRRGIYTIAVNNAATVARPNAWIFVDPPEKFHSAIWLDPAVTKFVHERFLDRHLREKCGSEFRTLRLGGGQSASVRDMPGVVSIVRNAEFRPERWLPEPSINWGNSKRSARRNHFPHDLNVMLAAIKLAYALGFRAVYLLGCDFNMREDRPYSFMESKHSAACGSNNGKYARISLMLSLLKPHFDSAGFHLFNCNARSGLTIFPHVPFTEAIQAASGHVPQDPLDTVDWYRKG